MIQKSLKYWLCLLVSWVCLGQAVAQGAKKPKVMVVPSQVLLKDKGLLKMEDNMGGEEIAVVEQGYRLALLDNEVRAAIVKIGELMTERGFPLLDMESKLKSKTPMFIDIEVELSYTLKKQGPRSILYFELKGLDAFSHKQIAAASGESAPNVGATPIGLLQQAVIDKLDAFNSQLQNYFDGLPEVGRETALEITFDGGSFQDEYGGKSYQDLIDEWLTAHCVKSAFSIDDAVEGEDGQETLYVSQAMIPLFNSAGKALSARDFYNELVKTLKTYKLSVKFHGRQGLGRSVLMIKKM